MGKEKWKLEHWISAIGVFLTFLCAIAAILVVPEVRCAFGLQSETCGKKLSSNLGETKANHKTIDSSLASIPSSSPSFGIDFVACRFTFDWETYIKNRGKNNNITVIKPAPKKISQGSGQADVDIATLNRQEKEKTINPREPYISQGCVRQKNFKPFKNIRYSDFEEGDLSTKEAFRNDPVLGLFKNANFTAQGNLGNINRVNISALNNIFSEEQLNEIYSTKGARTGMPRIFSTGEDIYIVNKSGKQIYKGGWCKVKNGKIVVRTTRAESRFDPTLYGRDPNDPLHSCAKKGKYIVEDRNLQVWQSFYELRFPNSEQCKSYFDLDDDICYSYFRNRYARDLAGKSSGKRIVAIQTFFGTFDDKYSKWIGWVNPDVNSIRAKSDDKFIRGYDGFTVFALD